MDVSVPRPWRGALAYACLRTSVIRKLDQRSDRASEQFEAEKQGEPDGQRPVPPRSLFERLAQGAGARFDLPRERHQTAGSDRFFRSVRGAAPEQRESDG